MVDLVEKVPGYRINSQLAKTDSQEIFRFPRKLVLEFECFGFSEIGYPVKNLNSGV